ncbi:DUF1178 family protein [Hydrogenophaga sp.]|uniref:DUF1178 family protein n=1 Tax=Hydrogenophaga sp. TaxID=1904254 RepID=UPI00272FFAD8|nr:DUF1178 family protein [Hydrogenophaga sp.]MDP2016612.1 DUF1178 family protein [Hydrogenophaga sp.]MDP3165473.1 DUF1178 family protein [Hydrogenophaga sp.]MDP3813427.1 DUF1178 family protein [Hydrogenophaga sp.]
MKVLNLQCAHQHEFEGWFGSEDDFVSQLGRGLVTCPMCGDAHIDKKLSAPRLNLRSGRHGADATGAAASAGAVVAMSNHATNSELAALQARMLKALREVVAQTEDVGERFADEARAMHSGETEHRNIRGQASPQEALAMLEEGIEVIALPMLPAVKETLQ